MIKRVVIVIIAVSFASPMAFSLSFSRTKLQSPSPTPTPTPTQGGPVALPPGMPVKSTPTPTPIQGKPPAMPLQAQPRPQVRPTPAPGPVQVKPTPTPVPPPDVKAYLDRQLENSNDKKFHLTVNGKDLALTPFHVWRQKSTGVNTTSTCIDMRSDEGRVYDIDFMTTGAQVSGIKIHRINGELLR